MSSEVEIVNIALDMIGATTITSLTEGSRNANVANRLYEPYRDALLRRYLWKFATKRIKLARSSNTPVYEYDYQYPVPSEFIRIKEVHDNADGLGTVDYRLEYDDTDTRVIATNADELWLTYIKKETDPNVFSPDFRIVLALKLASTFAITIASSRTLSVELKNEMQSELRAARSISSMEDYPEEMPIGTWAGVRHSTTDSDIY